ncbi:unnamed protein product [Mytilus coruscus]|uniref:Exonuclease domain-containing protein n=1 Tax=Mytilus coruscus TaxID=42192 RepID=A0A6J8DYM9_MYTCO|nr:unnamed protein product [Mytilus coruscus]
MITPYLHLSALAYTFNFSGVASLIGEKTGKIVHHTLRISSCHICRNAQKKGRPPIPQNCKKNWSGTAMGMEPDMVVQLVKDVHEQNIEINELAGDDDSVGFDRAKKLLSNSKMVSEAAGLSSGNETIKRAIRLNRKRVKKSERAKTKQHKKRRINLKKERSVKSTGVEMREGRTYESEIGMNNENLDEEIPAPINASLCIPIDISTALLVVFDLETTSLYTMELFKKIMPGLPSYSQTSLVSELGENYCAHNAVDDTRALFKLLTTKALNNLDSFVFPVSHPYDCIVQQDNLKSYNEAIACKAITRATALKAFKSNLKLSHLNLSVERMGLEGLKALLSEKTDRGHVRVTNCMKVIQKIFDFLTPES